MTNAWIQALGRLNSGNSIYMVPKKDSYLNGLLRETFSPRDARHSTKSPVVTDTTSMKGSKIMKKHIKMAKKEISDAKKK